VRFVTQLQAPNLIYHDITKQITADNVAALQTQRTSAPTAFLSTIKRIAAELVGFKPPPAVLAPAPASAPVTPPRVMDFTTTTIPGEGHCTLSITTTPTAASSSSSSAAAAPPKVVLLVGKDNSQATLVSQQFC
jgi:hypothetical protein